MQETVIVKLHLTPDIAAVIQAGKRGDLTVEERLKISLAIGLFAERTISLAKAARLAGMTRYEFALLLKQNSLPAYEYSKTNYQEDQDFITSALE